MFFLAQILLHAVVTLILFWICAYRWDQEFPTPFIWRGETNQELEMTWNLHPFLMSTGLIYLLGQGMLVYRSDLSRYICIHALSFDMLGLDLAAGESTQSSSTRCSTCLLSPALLWASSLPGTTRVSGQIRFHISTVFTPGSGLELWGYSRFR